MVFVLPSGTPCIVSYLPGNGLSWQQGMGGKRSPPSARIGAEQLERSKMRNQGAWAQVAVVFVFGGQGGKH